MANPAQSNRTHLMVMPGDGIGPEITAATLQVLREADRLLALGLSYEDAVIGIAALKAHGTKAFGERVAKVVAELAK